MELFLPSFFVLILTGVIVFGILPRVSPFIIFVLCTIFLFVSVRIHYNMFSDEYSNVLSGNFLQANAMNILIGVIVIGLLIATSNLFIGTNFPLPSISMKQPVASNSKVISSKKNYTNIPLEKLLEAERQI